MLIIGLLFVVGQQLLHLPTTYRLKRIVLPLCCLAFLVHQNMKHSTFDIPIFIMLKMATTVYSGMPSVP